MVLQLKWQEKNYNSKVCFTDYLGLRQYGWMSWVTKLNLIFIRHALNNSVSSLFTWKIKLNSIPKDSKRSLTMIVVPSIRRLTREFFEVTSRVSQTSKIQNWPKRWIWILFQPSLVSDAALHLSPLADRWQHHWNH